MEEVLQDLIRSKDEKFYVWSIVNGNLYFLKSFETLESAQNFSEPFKNCNFAIEISNSKEGLSLEKILSSLSGIPKKREEILDLKHAQSVAILLINIEKNLSNPYRFQNRLASSLKAYKKKFSKSFEKISQNFTEEEKKYWNLICESFTL